MTKKMDGKNFNVRMFAQICFYDHQLASNIMDEHK